MAVPASAATIPSTKHNSPEVHNVDNGVEVNVYMADERTTTKKGDQQAEDFYNEVESDNDISQEFLHGFEFLPVEKPKLSFEKEKQISVDPISLKESSMRNSSFNLMLLPPPLLPPAKPRFLSCSLPNSANSSPRFTSTLMKKKQRHEGHANPPKASNLARQHSAAHDHLARKQELYFQRSKSCADGRPIAPSDDLDLWLTKPTVSEYDNSYYLSFQTAEVGKTDQKNSGRTSGSDEEFKCGALCLFLPGFGRGKPVRPRKEDTESEKVISRTVSLEKFECGSWASSAIMHDNEEDCKNLYFDLPLELIQTSVNDAHSPVTAAFIFDNDQKGILKNSSKRTTAKKCDVSPRHVRFSTSQPTSPASCITPRLRKAREEFNAFLEAQGA